MYQVEKYATLARSSSFRYTITETGDFNNLPQVARELGFQRIADLSTKKAHWQIYDRPDHDVPNFPDGTTRISSSLAVYNNGDTEGILTLTHAILRTSREPYPANEFKEDLASFTKHYIERPRISGFPSKELTSIRNMAISSPAGMALLGTAAYSFIQNTLESAIIGVIIGEIGGPIIYGTLWGLSERHARRQIAHPEQYTVGNQAAWILEGERYHIVTVGIQKELYQALQQEGFDLSPDQFLEKIYKQIPQALVDKRYAEMKQAKYPKLKSPGEAENSLPELVKISHILQSI